MKILYLTADQITIQPNRQRKEWTPDQVVSLATSIGDTRLMHPVVVRQDEDKNYVLVAGERRMRAIDYLYTMGLMFKFGRDIVPDNYIPCVDQGTLTELEAFELELEENIRREDLSWQDRATATSQLLELRRLQAEKAGLTPPTPAEIGQEVRPEASYAHATDTSRKEIIVSKYLKDEDVAKADSLEAAFKVVKRKEELAQSARLGASVGRNFSSSDHQLVNTDCLIWMQGQEACQYDVILTDPPYGMDADQFGDSGGITKGEHQYTDDQKTLFRLMETLAPESYRLAKAQAHLYVFCDVSFFHWMSTQFSRVGWQVFRTPLIWHNPTSNRAPWPEHGPMRKWQAILYAVKGKKPANKLAPDLFTFPSDPNLNHQAQKPVALFKELLGRSCRPGDTVLDPFCGTGPIFPAAHELKVRATGIELALAPYGIAVKRVGELK